MFTPSSQQSALRAFLSKHLNQPVTIVNLAPLPKSTRDAPWRVDVLIADRPHSFVLRSGTEEDVTTEFRVLQALADGSLPVPRTYCLDLTGESLGQPVFLCDYVDGESLLGPMLSGAQWAADLYIETVVALQSISAAELGPLAHELDRESPVDVLESAYAALEGDDDNGLAEDVYKTLLSTMPDLPRLRFSNGDLWLDNILVRDQQLAGVIDFANAGFSDPVYEFLLPFFVRPELRGRGIEERYCRRIGVDPSLLPWYRGLEYFDTWRWVVSTGKPFLQYSAPVLERHLVQWLDSLEFPE